MNGDGKINSGTGWVADVNHADVMIAALERWVYVHGPEPIAPDVEYTLGLGSGK